MCKNFAQLYTFTNLHLSSFTGWTGWQEPLTVKFADGGNKKKNQYHNRQWIDRSAEVVNCCDFSQKLVFLSTDKCYV